MRTGRRQGLFAAVADLIGVDTINGVEQLRILWSMLAPWPVRSDCGRTLCPEAMISVAGDGTMAGEGSRSGGEMSRALCTNTRT